MVDKVEPPERTPVAKHPGITRRRWTTADGRAQTRYDAQSRAADGTKVTRSFRTIGDAQRWLDEARVDRHRGLSSNPKGGSETLGSFYARWRRRVDEHPRERDPRERTLIEYDRTWRLWIEPKLGRRSLGKITRDEVKAVVQTAGVRSPWRGADTLKVVRRVLSEAVSEGVLISNPASRVHGPSLPRRPPKVLSREQVAALADAVPPRYRAMVLVGAYGALRWSELVGLRADRVNLPDRSLHIAETLVEAGGRMIVAAPKTSRSRRTVTLPRSVAVVLEGHMREFPPSADGYVFTAPGGGPVRRPHFGKVWRRATAAADVAGFPVGSLRHCGATWMLEAGVNPVLVAFRMGHTTTRMIELHYADRLKAMDAEIADRLDAGNT